MKKWTKRILVICIVAVLLIFFIGLLWLKSKNSNRNSPGKELKRLLEQPEIKQTYLSHERRTNLETIKPDNEKSELTVRYQGSFYIENSKETFAVFWPDKCENAVEIAVASENPALSEKGLKFGAKLKFKISFFGRDVQKNWGAGRKVGGRYWFFDKNNNNFQLEKLNYQWENSQSLNPSFLGKWKIDLRKSVESGFAKINSKIRRRIEEQLSRDRYTDAVKYGESSLKIEMKEKNGLVQILGVPRYTIFWIKNLDDYTMACFTDYHPNHHLEILEDDAILTIFQLDKSKKKLTVFHPTIVEDVCRSIGVDGGKILGWVSYTWNREYYRLKPYFRENAQIIATKIE